MRPLVELGLRCLPRENRDVFWCVVLRVKCSGPRVTKPNHTHGLGPANDFPIAKMSPPIYILRKWTDGRVAGVGVVKCTNLKHHYRGRVFCESKKNQAFIYSEQLLQIPGVDLNTMTDTTRLKLLGGAFCILAAFWLWSWISGWGLVTVRAYDETFASIQRSIERQGGIRIVSNVPPETKLAMEVERVRPEEAVEVLAARVDGRWSVTFVAGPLEEDVQAGIAAIFAPDGDDSFRQFRAGGGGFSPVDVTPDVRKIRWTVSSMDEQTLGGYLDQFVQKTGAAVVIPSAWDPPQSKPPKGGEAAKALRAMVSAAGGRVEEVFAIVVRPQQDDGDRGEWGSDGAWGGGRSDGAATRGGGAPTTSGGDRPPAPKSQPNPEWVRERMVAQIEQLPAAEREVAKRDFDEMSAFFAEMRALPPDQRRAAMEQRMNDPVVQERMQERELRRDLNRGPDKRAARYRSYVARKETRRNAP